MNLKKMLSIAATALLPLALLSSSPAAASDPYGSVRHPQYKCLTPKGNATGNGTVITVWTCTGTEGRGDWLQMWRWSAAGELIHRASGRCLTPKGNSSANGAELTLWTCTGSPVQRWKYYESSTTGIKGIRGADSWKFVTPSGANVANGVHITQWDWMEHGSQHWEYWAESV